MHLSFQKSFKNYENYNINDFEDSTIFFISIKNDVFKENKQKKNIF